MIDGLGTAAARPEISGILAHWPFDRRFRVREMALDDDLGGRGHLEIDRLAAHDIDGASEISAHERHLVGECRDRHAGDERRESRTALKHGERHRLPQRLPHAMNAAEMLQRMDNAGHAPTIEQHDARNAPIGPTPVGRARHHGAPGIEIAPAVAVMDERCWQVHEIDRVASENVFLAGTARDASRRDRRTAAGGDEGLDDVSTAGTCIEPERERHARKVKAGLAARAGWRAEYAKARFNSFDVRKERRRRARLIAAAGDRADLEMPVDLALHLD
jgi:hypothetical protein